MKKEKKFFWANSEKNSRTNQSEWYCEIKKNEKKGGERVMKEFFKDEWLGLLALLVAVTALAVRLLK